MYSVIWIDKIFNSFRTNSWSKAFELYDKLFKNNITDLCIRDNEYGVEFRNYQWEQNENLIGWCRSYEG